MLSDRSEQKTYTFGSLFSGIGGLDLELERAGWKCAWQVEIDEWNRKLLQQHWPKVLRWDTVLTFPPEPTAEYKVDCIAGGFPCQPVSLAGKRHGSNDKRWLWPEFSRILRVLRPRCVLVENTPGLFTCGFDSVLGDLAEIGYDAEWSVLSACSLGAPHTRERVFIVAYPRGNMGHEGIRLWQSEAACEISTRYNISASVLQMEASHRNSGIVDGFSGRLDKAMRGLGNAVAVPVAEYVGRKLMDYVY